MDANIRGMIFGVFFICSAHVLTDSSAAKSRDPIKLALGTQTMQQLSAHIVGRVLVKAGYKVEFVELKDGLNGAERVDRIASGSVHVQPVFVVAETGDVLAQAIADKKVFSLGGTRTNGQDEPALKIVWAGIRKNWPDAEKTLKTMLLPEDDLKRIAVDVEGGKSSVDQSVDDWIKTNKSIWTRWVSASTNWMKP